MAPDNATPVNREPSADLFRVTAVVVVVIGHWLVSAVTFHGDQFGNDYPLDVMPWTRWLTLVFQVVPVFFLVGGYANAASWTRWYAAGGHSQVNWVRHRSAAIMGPTSAYVVLALSLVAVLGWIGTNGSTLWFGAWAVAMHLWFIPIYLVVVMLTPLAVAAHQRWGLAVPAGLMLAVAAVDISARIGRLPQLGSVNFLLCWAAIYQLGICWRAGVLGGRRPLVIAAASVIMLTSLLELHCYPVSMVGAPGAAEQNNFPPNIALLAFASAQSALLIAVAPIVSRRLRRARWQRLLGLANRNSMALYLWQMIPVVVVALVGYPTGVLPQPEPTTRAWWLFRLVWLLILSVVTIVELMLLWLGRSVFNRSLPAFAAPLSSWCAPIMLIVGVTTSTLVLWHLAVAGFAPEGRFPVVDAALYLAAVALICLVPAGPCTETTTARSDLPADRRPNESSNQRRPTRRTQGRAADDGGAARVAGQTGPAGR